jgi:hypothetical protein
MRRSLAFTALGLLSCAPLAPAAERPATLLVLDASGSMWGQIDGQTRIAMARDAVDALLDGWDASTALGLVAYGHRRKGDCSDIETLMPAEGFDAAAIRAHVAALQPKGMTPITASVRLAADQLRATERKATVILVSDGEETCDADPCALGHELEAAGVDFTAHVVGFDLADGSTAQQQLQCLARATGGRYVDARSAAELHQALSEVVEAEAVVAAEPVARPPVRGAEEWIEDVNLWPRADMQIGEARGGEHLDFEVGQTAAECQALCNGRDDCAAWVYEPAGSYAVGHPRCSLKGFGFAFEIGPMGAGEGWVAGVKPGIEIIHDAAASD